MRPSSRELSFVKKIKNVNSRRWVLIFGLFFWGVVFCLQHQVWFVMIFQAAPYFWLAPLAPFDFVFFARMSRKFVPAMSYFLILILILILFLFFCLPFALVGV